VRPRQTKSTRPLIAGGLITLVSTLLLLWIFPVLTHHFELKITDLKFHLRNYFNQNPTMHENIVMVNIDDYSKVNSGYELWPYSYYARVVEKINGGDPTSLGIDIMFTLTIDTTGWPQLLEAMENSYVTVNPYMVQFGHEEEPLAVQDHSHILGELSYDDLPAVDPGYIKHIVDIPYVTEQPFAEAGALGFINIEPDSDGILRRLPIVAEINGLLVPHFFLRLICEHLEYPPENIEVVDHSKLILKNFPLEDNSRDVEVPLDGNGNMLINYMSFRDIGNLIKKGSFSSFSAWDIMQSSRPPALEGKSVIFGDHSAVEKDFSNTPLDNPVANPLIFAIAMSNILNEEFIQPGTAFTTLLTLLILSALLIMLSLRLDVFSFGLTITCILILTIVYNFLLFFYGGEIQSLLTILLPLSACSSFILIYRIYESQVTMGVLEGSLKSYLSPHLMDKIKNDPDMLKLGGERKRISVLFSDIAGFTSFTDKADPAEVQEVLEEYFSEMTSIVFANHGIVDKYMGDGIMAFFENPKGGVISAQSAVKAASEMQNKAAELDEKYKDQNRFPFSVYVGIATGYAKVGNIGPPEKVDYTVIGSVVNKASRLDGPGDAGDILMDEDTYFFVKDDYEIDDFGAHNLKGFEKPVQIYRLKRQV